MADAKEPCGCTDECYAAALDTSRWYCAGTEIGNLRAERDRLRAALERIRTAARAGSDEFSSWLEQQCDEALAGGAEPNKRELEGMRGPDCPRCNAPLSECDCADVPDQRAESPASAPLTDDERALGEVIDERDTAHELLDRFAAAIGAMLGEDFGEHSSGNDPWANALEAIEEKRPQAPANEG